MAMVTPFAADGSINLDSALRWPITSSTWAPTASSSAGRPGRADRHYREKLDLLEAIVTEVGAGRRSSPTPAATTTTIRSPPRRPSRRRPRVPGRHPVLLEAAARGDRRALPGHRRRRHGRPVILSTSPARVLNLEPIVLAELRDDPQRGGGKQATPDLDQARHSSRDRPRPLCRERRPVHGLEPRRGEQSVCADIARIEKD